MTASLNLLQRKPVRISITVPHGTFDRLVQRSDCEGRSLSNLGAYLLESALQGDGALQRSPIPKR